MKLAFVHCPKTAGTFVRVYMDELLEKMGCGRSIFDARYPAGDLATIKERFSLIPGFVHTVRDELGREQENCPGCNRDWNDEQLDFILQYEPSLCTEHSFIHNHSTNWPPEQFYKFKKSGWKMFTFVKSLGDMMCSFYFYLKNQHQFEGGPDQDVLKDEYNLNVWGAPYSVIKKITLDEFLLIMLKHIQFMDPSKSFIPKYWGHFDFIAPYSDEIFAIFLKRYMDHDFAGGIPGDAKNLTDRSKKKLLVSGNLGYRYYCETGEISKATQGKITVDWRQKVFETISRQFLGTLGG